MRRRCSSERYLTAYADNELSPRLRQKVEGHLARCPRCATELDSIRASGRILKESSPPAVSGVRWEGFRRELSVALDHVDREARRPVRIPEGRPVYGSTRRRALAFAGACVVVLFGILVLGPAGYFPWRGGGTAVAGNECIVESIESTAAGYTPMYFSSEDLEMTVIWVFSEEVERGFMDEGPTAR